MRRGVTGARVAALTRRLPRGLHARLGVALVALMLSSLVPSLFESGQGSLHVLQAQGFLEGRTDIEDYRHDVAVFDGRFYVPFPPFPAVLLLPIVAAAGVSATKTLPLALLLAAVSLLWLRRILLELGGRSAEVWWVAAAFFAGTPYWLCLVRNPSVWFFAHLVAVALVLGAVYAALVRRSAALAGLALGLACLSRQMSILAAPFVLAALWDRARPESRQERVRDLLAFGLPLGLCLAAYLSFNQVRFGSPLDTGYTHIYAGEDYRDPSAPDAFLKARLDRYGLFHPAYVPFNFVQLFAQGFHVEFSPPHFLEGVRMDPFGTSLLFASPFLLAAFRARAPAGLVRAGWVSVGLSTLGLLLYHTNGWRQVNASRYALDFLPVLIVLAALGAGRCSPRVLRASIVYAVVLNVVALSIYLAGRL